MQTTQRSFILLDDLMIQLKFVKRRDETSASIVDAVASF